MPHSSALERLYHALGMPPKVNVGRVQVASRPLLRQAIGHLEIESLESDVDIAGAARQIKEAFPELVAGQARSTVSSATRNVGGTPPRYGIATGPRYSDEENMQRQLARVERMHEEDNVPTDRPGPVAAKLSNDGSKVLDTPDAMAVDDAVSHQEAMAKREIAAAEKAARKAEANA
jgi:hypothetical protein